MKIMPWMARFSTLAIYAITSIDEHKKMIPFGQAFQENGTT